MYTSLAISIRPPPPHLGKYFLDPRMKRMRRSARIFFLRPVKLIISTFVFTTIEDDVSLYDNPLQGKPISRSVSMTSQRHSAILLYLIQWLYSGSLNLRSITATLGADLQSNPRSINATPGADLYFNLRAKLPARMYNSMYLGELISQMDVLIRTQSLGDNYFS